MMLVHNVLFLSGCYYCYTNSIFASGFTAAPSSFIASARLAPLKNGYLDSINADRQNNDDVDNDNGPPQPNSQPPAREALPSIDLDTQRIVDRQSNLSFDERNRQSVNDDPRPFDVSSRFSQRPASQSNNMEPRQSWWDTTANNTPTKRIQGGSRHTYQTPHNADLSHVFLETDGRPLNTEIELWDGPNNTPTKLKVYSEDGRLRPINAMVENPLKGHRGNTMSVRNTAPMEFPINAGVSNVGDGRSDMQQFRTGGSSQSSTLAGSEAGGYLTTSDLNGYTRPAPSKKRGKRIQGGALETFPLDYSVEAVQVTLTTQGLPMNAKVELWGTSSHIKQVAEIYNDNGATRPFAAIVDTPGGSNTVAIYNTGPMEYPVEAVVEPVARREDWDGKEEKFGGSLAPW